MRSTLVAALALGSVLPLASAALGDHVVGNPGDPIRVLLEEARDDARVITIRVRPEGLTVGEAPERDYYRDHYESVETALRDADLKMVDDAMPTCAVAVPSEMRVYLSYPTCRESVRNKADAIKLLLHEATHLLGNEDEHLADDVALAVYGTWLNLDANRTPRWDAVDPNGSPGERTAHASVSFRDADGHDKLFVWGGCNEADEVPLECSTFLGDGGVYDLTAGSWEAVPPPPRLDAGDLSGARAHAQAVFTGLSGPQARHVLVFGGCSGPDHVCTDAYASVMSYDFSTKTWRRLPTPPAGGPEGRILHHAFWTGREMLVWGGVADPAGEGLGRSLVDGWLFDPAANGGDGAWRALPSSPELSPRRHASVLLTGSDDAPDARQLVVFGGCDRQVGRYCPRYLNDGAILDLRRAATAGAAAWRKIDPGPLSGRAWHSAVWTGTQMIIWGGQTRGPALRDGAIFTPGATPAEDRWLLVSGVVDDGRWAHQAVWTGDRMLVWGGQMQLGRPASKVLEFFLPTSATPVGRWNVPMATASPVGRWQNTAVWTGHGLLIWGGISEDRSYLGSGGLFLPRMEPLTPEI
jgi:hypothetical protein